jgi:sugar (pentulose or hexulose) kinase
LVFNVEIRKALGQIIGPAAIGQWGHHREEILAAIVRGLCEYQKSHLEEVEKNVGLQDVIHVTGGATNPSLIRAKARWMRDAKYVYEEQSSMRGAAMLGLSQIKTNGRTPTAWAES